MSSVVHTSTKVMIHTVVCSVSPMKRSKTCLYFVCKITDGKKNTMHVFGFNAKLQQKLVKFEGGNGAVVLANCEVKSSRKGEV